MSSNVVGQLPVACLPPHQRDPNSAAAAAPGATAKLRGLSSQTVEGVEKKQ